jgi:hypothetical protein
MNDSWVETPGSVVSSRRQTAGGPRLPVTNEIMMKMTAITSSTWAIHAASPATPLAPKASAIKAIIKKMIAYLSMRFEGNVL